MNRLRAATCTFINSIVGSFDYERLAEQYPRLEIVSSSIRAESRDYKETTTTTTRIRKRRRRRRRRKGGKKGEEDRNGWVGDGEGTMERLFWQDTKRHFICPVVEGRNLSCSSCHLPSIGAFLNRFPPSSSNCSTYSLQLTRRIVFAALFLHLQRDTSLPLETSVTRDIPFLRCFSSLLPFPFFFSSIRSNYVSRDPTVIS